MKLSEATERFLERLRAGEAQGHFCGLNNLDAIVGPLPAGTLTTIGAPTGVGKSSAALLMCLGASTRGVKAGYISVEDSPHVVIPRVLAAVSGVNSRDTMNGRLNEEEWGKLDKACEYLLECNVDVAFCIGWNDTDILEQLRKMAEDGCKLLIVDYIQAVQFTGGADRRNQVGGMASRIKALAEEHGAAAVLISQLSRPPGDRKPDWEPDLHKLKEAGELENASEVILLLWRTENNDWSPIHGRVAKCTWGGAGRQLWFRRAACGSFLEAPQPAAASEKGGW